MGTLLVENVSVKMVTKFYIWKTFQDYISINITLTAGPSFSGISYLISEKNQKHGFR